MLQFMGLQRVGHNLVTEEQQQFEIQEGIFINKSTDSCIGFCTWRKILCKKIISCSEVQITDIISGLFMLRGY